MRGQDVPGRAHPWRRVPAPAPAAGRRHRDTAACPWPGPPRSDGGSVRAAAARRSGGRGGAGRGQPIVWPYTWSTVIFISTLRSETMTARYSSQSGCSPAALR